MKPVLIYFRETPFKENKFILDFSDKDQHVRSIQFDKNGTYYIATLNCRLKLEKILHAHTEEEKNAISKLSEKSRILKDKGSDHFCDIDFINLVYLPVGKSLDVVDTRNNFYFQRDPKNLTGYGYKYKFWDQKEKKIRDGEFFSPYSQLVPKGLFFKQKNANIEFTIRIEKEKEEIHSFFYSKNVRDLTYHIVLEYYRNINLFFVLDENVPKRRGRQRWYTTNTSFFNEAICERVTNPNFDEKNFAKKYYDDEGKGAKVIGQYAQRLRLGNKKYLMPITWIFGSLWINLNEQFFTSDTLHLKSRTFLRDSSIKDLGTYKLTDEDIQEIRKLIPNFNLQFLHKFVKYKNIPNDRLSELIYYPKTSYQVFGQPEYIGSKFLTSIDSRKYGDYFHTDNLIFKQPYIKKIPSTLAAAENLFDKDVLEIKDLVTKTGNISKKTTNEQKNFILYDNSDVIQETFFTEIKKNISTYGMISTNYKHDNKKLINWQNKLEFSFKNDINKQSLFFQLEDAIEPKPIATEDSKMENITILKLDELTKKKNGKKLFNTRFTKIW